MTSKKMWFGTKDRMTWINCPAFNAPTSPVGWCVGGTLLNGGAWSRSSKTSHREYDFNWNLASAEDIYKVQDYASGLYGDGPFYFVMPGTETNILPEYYAAPFMATGATDEIWRFYVKNLELNPSFQTPSNIPAGMIREQQPDGSWWLINIDPEHPGYGHSPYGQSEYGR